MTISRPHRRRMDIKQRVLATAKTGGSLRATDWNRTPQGHADMEFLSQRKYFGHNGWYGLLRRWKIEPVEHVIRKSTKQPVVIPLNFTPKSARAFIRRQLELGAPASATHWKKDNVLNKIYVFSSRRGFFGNPTFESLAKKLYPNARVLPRKKHVHQKRNQK